MKTNLLIYRKQEKRTYGNKTNLADIIFVKKNTRTQFWAPNIYAKKRKKFTRPPVPPVPTNMMSVLWGDNTNPAFHILIGFRKDG